MPKRIASGSRIVVLSGAGLSRASGIPTFRDADGLWEGHDILQVATPAAWQRDRALVRKFYDERRSSCAAVIPNEGHTALARLQHTLGTKRCTLVTQNIDGLLQKASADEVIEMHGSLFRLRCSSHADHPRISIFGPQSSDRRCTICGAFLRPDIVWFGELPYEMDRIQQATAEADLFVSVGTSGVVYPAAGLVEIAHSYGAHTVEINPIPTEGAFEEVIAEPAETALPRLVRDWLGES